MKLAMCNKNVQKILEYRDAAYSNAGQRYNKLNNEALYIAAMGDDVRRGEKIMAMAMALCGSMDDTMTWGNLERLTPAEARFLACFCRV